MKRINTLIMILLGLIAIYLLFRLFTVEDFARLDYIFLILLIGGGMVNTIIFYLRKKKGK